MRFLQFANELSKKFLKAVISAKAFLPFLPDFIRFQFRGNGEAWRISTHLTVQERLTLYKLARRQIDKSEGNDLVLCEIGSYLGASSCFLAAAANETKKKSALLHCVDTWENLGMTEGLRDTFNEFKKNTDRFSHIIVTHIGDSSKMAHNFKGKIDLLFIDGDHSYEGCRRDVESWLPQLKPHGLIVLHDYGWAEGVRKVVLEMVLPRTKECYELPNMFWARI